MGRQKLKHNLVIPHRIIKKLPVLAETVYHLFNRPITLKTLLAKAENDEIDYVGSVWLGVGRSVPIYIAENFTHPNKKVNYNVLASYYNNDCICIFRSAIKKKISKAKNCLMIQRVLAHEIAHAIDRKRILRMGRKKPVAGRANSTRIKYCCHPLEYDAEFASIAQVAIPYMLSQRNGASMLIDFFTNSKRLLPLCKYKPFWPITFNGYLADWSHNDKVCRRFFHDLAIVFYDSLHHLRPTKRFLNTAHPIIKACLKKMKNYSPTLGVALNSTRNSRVARSCASSRKNGSANVESGERNTDNTSSLKHGKRSVKSV